jgi:hypothetical protein
MTESRDTEALATLERVVIGGDLAKLTAKERLYYYEKLCASVGLNPLTRPFQYLTLSGKLVLYASRDATDQLRRKHGVSITRLEQARHDDLYVVTAYGQDKDGRQDTATGAVSIATLKGDALANAIMKSETKAKRRLTLSLCGLGMLDETEVDTVKDARPVAVDPETGEILPPPTPPPTAEDRERMLARIGEIADRLGLAPAERRALWDRWCGAATTQTVDLSALADLLAALEAM